MFLPGFCILFVNRITPLNSKIMNLMNEFFFFDRWKWNQNDLPYFHKIGSILYYIVFVFFFFLDCVYYGAAVTFLFDVFNNFYVS